MSSRCVRMGLSVVRHGGAVERFDHVEKERQFRAHMLLGCAVCHEASIRVRLHAASGAAGPGGRRVPWPAHRRDARCHSGAGACEDWPRFWRWQTPAPPRIPCQWRHRLCAPLDAAPRRGRETRGNNPPPTRPCRTRPGSRPRVPAPRSEAMPRLTKWCCSSASKCALQVSAERSDGQLDVEDRRASRINRDQNGRVDGENLIAEIKHPGL